MYLIYGYEIFRDYRRVKCLLISQILDIYVFFFYVRYRISKLGSRLIQAHKAPILGNFYHFEVLCFHSQTKIHINLFFYFARPHRKLQEKS